MQYLPMSYDDYVELPDEVRPEWVDGTVVVAPYGVPRHQRAARRLVNLIEDALPGLWAEADTTIRLPHNRERRPDVVVWAAEPVGDEITRSAVLTTPVLVAEILSPSTRREDLLRKGPEYAGAGIAQYWIVDPDARTIEVSELVAGRWETAAVVDDDHPTAEVTVGEWGAVPLDLGIVLDS